MRALAWMLLAVLAGACGLARADTRPARAGEGRTANVPVHEAAGTDAAMAVTWFLPAGPGPFPVVVFSHGRDPSAAERARMEVGVGRAQRVFWLARGVAVVAPVRPGYGAGAGADIEADDLRVDGTGRCIGHADFGRTADAAVRAIEATLAWLRGQPWADADAVLLVGQSVGGLATVAAGARTPPGVVGYVNFAGGSGGNPERAPGMSCDAAQLGDLYAGYGRSTTLPNLWLYASNDRYWGPEAPRAWHAAFARGGSPTRFVQAPPVPDGDGHDLSRHAPALWAPAVDDFLAGLGFPWNASRLPRPVLRLDPGGA